jgi:hypothetical protein
MKVPQTSGLGLIKSLVDAGFRPNLNCLVKRGTGQADVSALPARSPTAISLPQRRWARVMVPWLFGSLEMLALLIVSIWLLAAPRVFQAYYPFLNSRGNVSDATLVSKWLWSKGSVFDLNPNLSSGKFIRKELSHYADVRRWLRRTPPLFAGLLLSMGILWQISPTRETFSRAQWRGLTLLMLLSTVSAAVAFWNWRFFFAAIHYPFFGSTSWKLPDNCYSLRLFPSLFWQFAGSIAIALPAIVLAATATLLNASSSTASER